MNSLLAYLKLPKQHCCKWLDEICVVFSFLHVFACLKKKSTSQEVFPEIVNLFQNMISGDPFCIPLIGK